MGLMKHMACHAFNHKKDMKSGANSLCLRGYGPLPWARKNPLNQKNEKIFEK